MSESPWATLTRMYHSDWYPNHSPDRSSKDCYQCQRIHDLIVKAQSDALAAAVRRVEAIPQIEWALNPYPAVTAAIKGVSDE